LEEFVGILAVTSKSRMLKERLKATTGKCWEVFLQRLEEEQQIVMFLTMSQM